MKYDKIVFVWCHMHKKKAAGLLFFQTHLPQKDIAGELAPMRCRRLLGFIGPCPSTTLDKKLCNFFYCNSFFFCCQQIFEKNPTAVVRIAVLFPMTQSNRPNAM